VRAGGARQIGGLTKPVGHSLHLAAGPHSGGGTESAGDRKVGACAITADLTGKLSAAARTPY